jgi:hypothetical protein
VFPQGLGRKKDRETAGSERNTGHSEPKCLSNSI